MARNSLATSTLLPLPMPAGARLAFGVVTTRLLAAPVRVACLVLPSVAPTATATDSPNGITCLHSRRD